MNFEYDEAKSSINKAKYKVDFEEPKRVNIDFPSQMVQSLDKEAKHIGVSRQAVIKMWLAEKLQSLNKYQLNYLPFFSF